MLLTLCDVLYAKVKELLLQHTTEREENASLKMPVWRYEGELL